MYPLYPQRFYHVFEIRKHSEGKTHFFDPSSMRFFKSRISEEVYSTSNPFISLFVTSEKYENRYSGTSEPRYYTVRSYDYRTSDIKTIGQFQEYRSLKAAKAAAERLAKEVPYSLEDQYDYAHLLNEEYDNRLRYNRKWENGIGQFELWKKANI